MKACLDRVSVEDLFLISFSTVPALDPSELGQMESEGLWVEPVMGVGAKN